MPALPETIQRRPARGKNRERRIVTDGPTAALGYGYFEAVFSRNCISGVGYYSAAG